MTANKNKQRSSKLRGFVNLSFLTLSALSLGFLLGRGSGAAWEYTLLIPIIIIYNILLFSELIEKSEDNKNMINGKFDFHPLLGLRDIAYDYTAIYLQAEKRNTSNSMTLPVFSETEQKYFSLIPMFTKKVHRILCAPNSTTVEKYSILRDIDNGEYDEDLMMDRKNSFFTPDSFPCHPIMRRRGMATTYVDQYLRTAKFEYDENKKLLNIQYIRAFHEDCFFSIGGFANNVNNACSRLGSESVNNEHISWILAQIENGTYDNDLFRPEESCLFKPHEPLYTVDRTCNYHNYMMPNFNLDDKSAPITNPQEGK